MTDALSALSPDEMAATAQRALATPGSRRENWTAAARAKGWQQAADLGWLMLTLSEDRGGLGQGLAPLAALYVELGRALSPLPVLETMLTVETLARTDADAEALFAALASGEARIALPTPGAAPLAARHEGAGLRIDGEVSVALWPEGATHLLLPVRIDDSPAEVLVALPRDGVVAQPLDLWDRSRALASVSVSGLLASDSDVVVRGDAAAQARQRRAAHFELALACDALGGAEQILTDTVEYTRTRQQFDRPIGTFQALKHRCADMKTWLEAARALTLRAVEQFDRGDTATPLAAGARLLACETYRKIATDAVQIHGGIGFTWEMDCHLFLKRALLNEQLGGTPEDGLDRLFAPFGAQMQARAAGVRS